MALTGTYVQEGYSVPNSYVIARSQALSSVGWAGVIAEIYPSQEARLTWPSPLFTVFGQFAYDLNSPDNLYVQSYNYLLTMPQFQGFQSV